ncbi:MAG: NAD-binding protein [Chloroflexota bacterium]
MRPDLETARPAFESMGSRIVHVGGQGMGTSLKIIFNHMLAVSLEAFAEGMVLGQALGLSEEMLFDVLLTAPVTAPTLARKREKMASGDYSDTEFPLELMQKDLQMTATAAYEVGVAMPVANAAKEVYQLANRAGWSRADMSAIYQFLKDRSGDGA